MIFSSNKSLVKSKAFTLIELLVVISIIGVLAALTAGAVFKYAAWQRDPTNPNSSVSITINTIKQAVTRITQDIQQKAKQDYQALSATDKAYYQTVASGFTELDPNTRAIQVYANMQIVKNFPTAVSAINATTANTIIKNKPSAGSTPNRDSSACLLVALESHPKGLKVEDLGSGSIATDTTNARIIKPGGVVIYLQIHNVDANDYNADKSFKVGSLRVDIVYDTE
ncbi:MAG: type II secretion system protein [Planctomycetota bacterium]